MSRGIIVSLVVAVLLITGAYTYKSSQSDGGISSNKSYNLDEIKQANGKSGLPCLVAVDGKVYEIEQGFKWQDGQHTTSFGQAYCGADLSAFIDKAPHGRSKLAELKVVGTFLK